MADMCAYAKRTPYAFLLCRKLVGDNNVNGAQEASKYMCAFQRYCALTHLYENTDSSRNCNIKLRREE